MKRKIPFVLGGSLLAIVAGALAGGRIETVVTLCDNRTQIVIDGLQPGTALDRGRAFQVAEKFMDVWREKNPGSNWIMAKNYAANDVAMQVRSTASGAEKQSGTYSGFTAADEFVWKTE